LPLRPPRWCRRSCCRAGQPGQHRRQTGQRGSEGVIRRSRVADHQRGTVPGAARVVAGQPVDGQPARAGPGDDVILALAAGQPEQRLQAGGDPGDLYVRRLATDHCRQPVPAPAVGEPGMPDLAVVAAGGEQPGERELVKAARMRARRFLDGDHLVHQRRWHGQPAQAQPRREALARRARVHDVVGCQRLHGAHGLAVVAELPVVVVLDHQPGAGGRPLEEGAAPPRRQGHAERELVRGRQHDRTGRSEVIGHGAVAVDRQRQHAHAVRLGDPPVGLVPVVLDADGRGAARTENLAEQGQPVGEAGTHDDLVAGDADPAHPGQVARQRRPQLRQAARVRVAQDVVGRGAKRGAGRCQPGPARERAQVRHPGPQVVAGRGQFLGDGGWRRLRTRAVRRHPGSRSGACRQPALRDELPVGLGNAVARDAEISREHAGGRQPAACVQPPVPHRVAQRGFQTGPHARGGQVQMQIEAGIGPSFLH